MKRSPMPQRTTPLKRSPIRSSNPTRSRKRRERTAAKRQTSHTRAWRKNVLARDRHRCTAITYLGGTVAVNVFAVGECEPSVGARCPETTGLHAHHLTYKRLGAEWLEDGVTLCRLHHGHIESSLRWWKRGRRR